MANGKDYALEITSADEGRLLMVKAILGYEASVRGLTLGQTVLRLLNEAVDTDGYPEEVRYQLDVIRESLRCRAIERAVDVVRIAKSA